MGLSIVAADRKHQICVKNIAPEEVLERANELRNQWGGKAKSWNCRQWTHYPTVQGEWTSFFKIPEIKVVEFPSAPESNRVAQSE